MKLWIRQSGSSNFRGPFPREELGQRISAGEVTWDDEALEANGQSYGALKRSTEWCPLRAVVPPDQLSTPTPRLPSESDHCFILHGDERRGPYLLAQIRTMWKNGSITADSGLLWGEVTEPVPVTVLLNQPRFAQPEASAASGGTQALTVLGVIIFVGGMIGLIYYWQFFDTSVSVPTERFFGQTFGGGRVHNIGLMQERQNGMIISGIAAALGFICILFGQYAGKRR